jgi:adenosylcobinamide kinase/adenosylcobinamide-phosphate guanylyltransferase
MLLRLLGTGASDGWPNPWCECASCGAAAAAGVVRGQTSALLDDRLLLDIGPEAPRAALRQGTSLAGVKAVLVTHAHPDHHASPAWMWRGWAAHRPPLTLVAPPAVLEQAKPRLDDSVTTLTARAGDELSVAGYAVRVLPADHGDASLGPAVLYDVTGPDRARVLWGTDTGPLLPQALDMTQDREYDAVLLELTSGHLESGHLDLTSWREQVAELHRRAAVTSGTRLLAVHLGHDNPPPDQLDAALAGCGATAPRDGDVLELVRP